MAEDNFQKQRIYYVKMNISINNSNLDFKTKGIQCNDDEKKTSCMGAPPLAVQTILK